MNAHLRRLTFAFAALVALAAFASPADAQPGPALGVTYTCWGNPEWATIKFHNNFPTGGTLRRGFVDIQKPGGQPDNKKCDIAWMNNSNYWEFTLPLDGVQCKDMIVYGRYLIFGNCSGTGAGAFTCRF